jgi:hypothetical protein
MAAMLSPNGILVEIRRLQEFILPRKDGPLMRAS